MNAPSLVANSNNTTYRVEGIEKWEKIWVHFYVSCNKFSVYLECLDGGGPVLLTLVVVTREWPFEHSSAMTHVNGLFHSNITPVGHLNDAGQVGHREEGGVVLVMDCDGRL